MKKNVVSIAAVSLWLGFSSAGASDFSGSYAGVKVGSNIAETSGTGTSTSDERASTYGLEVGHGWDMGATVLGLDGFYDKNREASHTPVATYGSAIYGLGLKLGLPLDYNLMPYAKLGYAHTSGTKALANFDDNGLHGGLGLEYKFAPSWGITGEWTTTSPRKYGTTFKNNNFTIGLNYYFSQSEAAPVRAVKEAPSPVAEAAPSVPAQPKEAWKAIVDEKLVRIEGASFDTNSAKLKSAADVKLNEVVEFSKKYPDAILEVSGYTDSLGSKELNMALSQRRAESVKAYLVAKGVAADHIVAKGYGIDNPVADNGTAAGRTLNRRVEIRYTIREEKRIRVSE